MANQDRKGKVQTVLGLVDSDELGITLPHEHIFIDFRFRGRLMEPTDPEENRLSKQKITLDNLWYARYHRGTSMDNLVFDSEDLAIKEVMNFKNKGGRTIADMSCKGIGCNPAGLRNVAKATGVNIIMGATYYHIQALTPEMRIDSRSEEDIAEELIRDITFGVGDTGIKAGHIGETGLSFPLEYLEKKTLHAAGITQQQTGVPINIHPGACEDAPFEYLKVLDEVGADPCRVVFSHMTRTFPISARTARARLAEKGSYLEFDLFGTDGFLPLATTPYLVANDEIRINLIMETIEDGFLDRILISHDVYCKVGLRAYGGPGYSYILDFIVPRMLKRGITEEQINTIMIENPRRVFTIV